MQAKLREVLGLPDLRWAEGQYGHWLGDVSQPMIANTEGFGKLLKEEVDKLGEDQGVGR